MRRDMSHRVFTLAILLLVVLAGGGCGFQPRGQALDLAGVPSPIHIAGIQPYSTLHRELGRQIEQAGAGLAASSAEAAAVLRVSDWTSDSRLLSVDSRNKAVEFELEESARFSLRSRAGSELAPEQTVRVLRIQYRPQDAILASNREVDLLREDMRRDLATQIVRRLAAR